MNRCCVDVICIHNNVGDVINMGGKQVMNNNELKAEIYYDKIPFDIKLIDYIDALTEINTEDFDLNII